MGDILAHDKEGLDPEVQSKVQNLLEILSPQTLEDRVRFLVMEMPWDYPCDEKIPFEDRGNKQREAVEDLITDLLKQPEEIRKFIPIINDLPVNDRRGQMRMASTFGQALAEKSADPAVWLDCIVNSLRNIQPDNRDFEMLSGYMAALAKEKPEIVEEFKQEISSSYELARALPPICWRMNVKASDISLVCSALQSGFIKPYDLWQWSCGGVLAKSLNPAELSHLFNQLLSMGGDGFSVGIDLMGMYAHGRRDVLGDLIPQIKLAAEKISTRQKRGGSQMDEHHFQEIMTWVLKRGKTDPDARAVALILTNYLLESVKVRDKEIMKPLLPLTESLREAGVDAINIPGALRATAAQSKKLASANMGEALVKIVQRVDLGQNGMRLTLLLTSMIGQSNTPATILCPTITRDIPVQIQRRGVEMKLVISGADTARADPVLIKAVARARIWFEELQTGTAKSFQDIANRYGVSDGYVGHLLPLAFLAPDIVEAIVAGQLPVDLTTDALIKRINLPADWSEQRRILGFN